MKTRMYFLAGLFALIFLAPSCKQENDVEQASLSLSTQSLQFEKAAGEQAVTVETNQDKWSFIQNGDWFTVTQSATGLSVAVSENSRGVDRKGSVVVLAGGLAEKVEVMQSASDIMLSSIPDKLVFLNEGAKKRVEIITNGEEYDVTVDEGAKEWVSVEKLVGTKSFYVTVKKNENVAKREAKLYVKIGKALEELPISQDGQFLLPFFGISEKTILADVYVYEENRKSILTGSPDGLFNTTRHTFSLKSDLNPVMIYDMQASAKIYTSVITGVSEKVFNGNDFQAYVKSLGFAEDAGSSKEAPVYINEELSIKLSVKLQDGLALLEFTPIPKQPEPYETFSAFPYTKIEFLQKEKAEAVLKYEEEQGTKILKEKPGFKSFEIPSDKIKEGLFMRSYFFKEKEEGLPDDQVGLVKEEAAFYNEATRAIWLFGDKPIITKEFEKLLMNEGFKLSFYNEAKKAYFYVKTNPANDKEDLYIAFTGGIYTDVNPGKVTVHFHFFIQPKRDKSSFTAVDQLRVKPEIWDAYVAEISSKIHPLPFK